MQRAVADVFIKQFVTRAKALKVGDPMDASTEVGPMTFVAQEIGCSVASKRPRLRVLSYFVVVQRQWYHWLFC